MIHGRCSWAVQTLSVLTLAAAAAVAQGAPSLDPLLEALAEKNAEAVLLRSLDFDPLPEGAAPLLAAGAQQANLGGDYFLAMQLCQRALKVAPHQPEALLACIEAARKLDQFDPALEWTALFRNAHPRDPRGLLWEARLAEAEGEWKAGSKAAAALKKTRSANPQMLAEARGIADRCALRESEASAARTKVSALEDALAKARTARAHLASTAAAAPGLPVGKSRVHSGVTLYSTRWCGYCKKAKRWLRAHHVRFKEIDIEKKPRAVADLVERALEQKVRIGGVPIFMVNGDLMGGWSEQGLERLLKRHGYL